ncbi:MAG TPA: SRPBCC family protein [Gaiellales bacterium]
MQAAETAVRASIVVDAPIDRAFHVFTTEFGSFKPPGHTLLTAAVAETVFEPRVGGYLYDRGVDGSECRWARVRAYEPPHRVVLSWLISPQWQLEPDPDKASEWEVRFTAEAPGRTRVEVEHRHLERHGEGWQGVRAGVGGDEGWPLYLERYAGLLAPAPLPQTGA